MRNFYPLNTRHVFIPLVLFVALAVGFLLLFPGGFAQAQDASNTPYQENGTGPVTTFTATDPEGGTIYWSLLAAVPSPTVEVDGDPLVLADFEDNGDFSISAQGVLTFNIPPDYEDEDDTDDDNVYNIVVVASDDALGAGTTDNPTGMAYKKVTIMVTDVPEPGIVTLSSLQPQVDAALTATLTDPEVDPLPAGTDVAWKWEKSQDMSSWTPIDSVSAAMRTPDATTVGYYLRATATYDDTANNDRTAQAVSVNKVRAAPTTTDALAAFPTPSDDNNRSVAENSPAGTNVGAPVKANDTTDDVLTYSLTEEGGFQINPATGQITVGPRTNMNHEENPSDEVTVTVTEAGGRATAITPAVTITVTDVNEAPMVTGGVTTRKHAEDDADIDTDDTTVLMVSTTYTASDPEGGTPVLSLQGADAGKFTFDPSNAGILTFKEIPNYEMPADAGANNVYNVTVVATDNGVDDDGKNKMTATRAVTIMVTNVEENGTVTLSSQQPQVGIPITASVDDPDGSVTDITWQWYRTEITLNTATGKVDEGALGGNESAIAGATSATYTPTAASATPLWVLARYKDGKGNDTARGRSVAAGVVVRTDNAPKFLVTEDGKRSIVEGTYVTAMDMGAPVRAMDTDTTQLLTYRLSGPDASPFSITSDTDDMENARGGQLAVKAGTKLDYETKSTYRVAVTATDPDNLSASIDVTIMVNDMNEAPEVTGDAEKDYPENQTRDVASYSATDPEGRAIHWSLLPFDTTLNPDGITPNVDSADAGDFSISARGVLTFNIPPDHESPDDAGNNNIYNIVVVASDDAPGAAGEVMGYKKVVVTVTDEDEPGIVTLSSLQPQVDVELTATLDDPEADSPADLTWKWEQSRNRNSGWAAIDASILATRTPDDTDTIVGSYLRATATYKDADGTERTAAAVSANKVREAPAADTVGEFPATPSTVNNRVVAENSPAGTNVGDPVKANDTTDDVLTYSLTGNNDGGFEIDPVTAQITVGPRTNMNHEENPTYSVTVTVTEAGGNIVNQPVTITVTDLNEAPMVTGGVTMLEKSEYDADPDAINTDILVVSTYTASDPEGGTPVLSLQGADAGKFIITDGALTFKEAPNYEMPADAGANNEYNVTVVATDDATGVGNKMTATRAVTIMVTNVEEDGTVTLSAQQPKIGVPLTASVTDLDGPTTDVTWKWERDDDRVDGENENNTDEEIVAGATSATYTPTSDDAERYLRAIAMYTDPEGKDTSMATSVAAAVVRTDNAPKFADAEDGIRSIREDRTDADDMLTDDVGLPIQAMDADADQILTYSLSGADAGSFSITSDTGAADDARGGQITAKAGTKLDYETKSTYMVTVTATDPGGVSGSIDVTIKVTDVNEAPEILVGGLSISGSAPAPYAENGTGPVATYRAIGSNAASATWALSGADAGDFRISSSGVLTFRQVSELRGPCGCRHRQRVPGNGESQRPQVQRDARRDGERHRRVRGTLRA